MPSKEHEALVEKVAEIAEKYGDFADGHDAEECASEIISTIRAALQEPSEVMTANGYVYCYNPDRTWRAMLAASALGEQSDGI